MPTRHPSPITPRPHRSLEGEGEDISHSAHIHKLLELMSIIRGDVVTGLRPPHPTLIKALSFRHLHFILSCVIHYYIFYHPRMIAMIENNCRILNIWHELFCIVFYLHHVVGESFIFISNQHNGFYFHFFIFQFLDNIEVIFFTLKCVNKLYTGDRIITWPVDKINH